VRKASFFEFSLYLSRACLGKMIVFMYKWLKKAVFCRLDHRLGVCDAWVSSHEHILLGDDAADR
jgi:hypothetical protein